MKFLHVAQLRHPGKSSLAPMLRAYSAGLHESSFYPNLGSAHIYLQSSPPFLIPKSSQKGIYLQFWQDPACPVQFSLRLSWSRSLGKLVLHYRSLVAAWPALVIFLVLRRQLVVESGESSPSLSFSSGLDAFIKIDFWKLSIVSFIACIGQCAAIAWDLGKGHRVVTLLLGNRHILLAGLAPTFLAVSSVLVFLVHGTLSTMLIIVARAWSLYERRMSNVNNRQPMYGKAVSPLRYIQQHITDLTITLQDTLTLRLLSFGILVLVIVFLAPHQFAFLVLLLIHFDTTLRSYLFARNVSVRRQAILPI